MPDVITAYRTLRKKLMAIAEELPLAEQTVLIARFGLATDRCMTLGEVSKAFNIGRERIRQIEAKALRKLRPQGKLKLSVCRNV